MMLAVVGLLTGGLLVLILVLLSWRFLTWHNLIGFVGLVGSQIFWLIALLILILDFLGLFHLERHSNLFEAFEQFLLSDTFEVK